MLSAEVAPNEKSNGLTRACAAVSHGTMKKVIDLVLKNVNPDKVSLGWLRERLLETGDFDPNWLSEQWEDFIKFIVVANVRKKSEALVQRVAERTAQPDQTDKAAPATKEPLSRSCDTGYGEVADADRSTQTSVYMLTFPHVPPETTTEDGLPYRTVGQMKHKEVLWYVIQTLLKAQTFNRVPMVEHVKVQKAAVFKERHKESGEMHYHVAVMLDRHARHE